MERNTDLREQALAMRTRRDLKRLLHEHAGLTLGEASAKIREVLAAPEEKDESEEITTRAGVARAFRDSREREAEKHKFLRWMIQKSVKEEDLADQMARELAAELDASNTDDEREAKLVRLDWDDSDVCLYMREFGKDRAGVDSVMTADKLAASLTHDEMRQLKREARERSVRRTSSRGYIHDVEGHLRDMLAELAYDPKAFEVWRKNAAEQIALTKMRYGTKS